MPPSPSSRGSCRLTTIETAASLTKLPVARVNPARYTTSQARTESEGQQAILGDVKGRRFFMTVTILKFLHLILLFFFFCTLATAQMNYTKAQVGERIRQVEDGVDKFRDYLDNRGEETKNRAESAQSSGTSSRRRRTDPANTEARKDQAKQTKDDLEDALDDLNRSTNRLRRKFDPSPNYIQTKAEMERVMDAARRVNEVMVKGNYGTQPQRYWTPLRAAINDLARCYDITPMAA